MIGLGLAGLQARLGARPQYVPGQCLVPLSYVHYLETECYGVVFNQGSTLPESC
jgi:hypothetical protein